MRPIACWSAIAVLVRTMAGSFTAAETLNVPADYPTIQACIDAAVNADECVVAPGTYNETIDFLGKAVRLRSSDGADVTAIDATGIGGSVVTCAAGEHADTVLAGFTITGGTGTDLGGGHTTGGGMYNEGSSPTVMNCAFTSNTAKVGGGMRNASGSARVIDCTFTANTAGVAGGGVANSGGSPEISGCTFSGNSAAQDGGAVYNWGGSPKVTGCMIAGNAADVGGGMWNGSNLPSITHCVFVANTARFGAGMLNGGSDPRVTGCTFSGNVADDGGAMFNTNSDPVVFHSILWGDRPQEAVNATSALTMGFSNLLGGLPAGTVNGGGNTSLNPQFTRWPDPGPDGEWDGIDDDYGNLRLQPGSPCINAGDPQFVPSPSETDLDGHARVLCGRVDMGAYEFGIGDYNCDQAVDLADFAAWPDCMLGPGAADIGEACVAFDFNADGGVDLSDFQHYQVLLAQP